MELSGWLAFGLIGAGIVGAFWLLGVLEKRRAEAVRQAAAELGLVEVQTGVFAGSVKGVPVRLGLGCLVVEGAPISHVAVFARFEPVLGFPFSIAQAGAWPLRDARVDGDEEFNRACELRGGAAVLSLLGSPATREVVRDFIRAGQGCSSVSQEGALFKVMDAHVKGSASVKRAVERSCAMIRALRPDPVETP